MEGGSNGRSRRTSDLEEMIAAGLPNRWYLIARSDQLAGEPVAIRRLGIDLVLWRDKDGVPQVQEDRCPHRGARLSQGRIRGDTIVCPYHGVSVARDGTIDAVPACPSSSLVGKPGARTFPAREHNMGIWAYFAAEPGAEPCALDFPEELTDPAWGGYLWTGMWRCNYTYVLDNLADPMHGTYLHGGTYTLGGGGTVDRMRLVELEDGFRVEREAQRDKNFDWAEFHDTGYFWVRIDIPYPPSAGPGGPLRIIGTVTPIDRTSCQVFFAHQRRSSGWQHDMWRLLYRTALYPRHMQVLAQDQAVLEAMDAHASSREMLYQHDIGVSRLRRLLIAEARKLKAARNAAGAAA